MRTAPRHLIASYRIQLTPEFGFAATIELLDHIAALGVSHLYLSPIAEAVAGSTHGYDVVDHRMVRSDFGGEAGLDALLDAADEHGLGIVIDHVPNHVSAARAELNPQWWDVLRDGPESTAARWFDVDWEHAGGRILVPKLGDPLVDVLAAGELHIGDGDRGPELRYGPLRFPLAPGSEMLPVEQAVDAQHYELMWWRDERRNVRRFFTIDDLVAVKVEDPMVAEIVDTIPTRLAEHPAFAGVRVDHVDGLADPLGYLVGLRRRIGDDRWLVVEKILAAEEELPPSWPVDGTTGYEHIRVTEHAFLDPSAEGPLSRLWVDLTGDARAFAELEDEGRGEVIDHGLRPDLERLVRVVHTHADAIRDPLGAAIELTLGLHRYRTYLPDDADSLDELDIARRRAVDARPDLADDIDALAALVVSTPAVAQRWQQLTSPVMAKGAEDRAFYRYLRLAALCEVGGAPGSFGIGTDEFHRYQAQVQRTHPASMLAGTTHDTKRSEDVRTRALALAEIADEWSAVVRAWLGAHADLANRLDAPIVLLALETAVTAWPVDADRLLAYLVKSAREADLLTTWTDPNGEYETALGDLARELDHELVGIDPDAEHASGSLAEAVARTLRPGWSNSIAVLAVRLTAPGVPDLYQGTEALTYSLVDPDNRREPDWARRRHLLEVARRLDAPTAWRAGDVDAAKTAVVSRTLALRRRRPDAFGAAATYTPVVVGGEHAGRLLAFARGTSVGQQVVTLAVRRSVGADAWNGTTIALPDGTWRDVLTDDAPVIAGGSHVAVSRWLDHFPVAILERTDT